MPDQNDKRSITGGTFGNTEERFSVHSSNPGTQFDFQDVQPLVGEYVDVNDQLVIGCAAPITGNTLIVNVRVLTVDGKVIPMQFAVAPAGAIAFTTFRFQLLEGFLLSATARYSAGFRNNNWCYVELALARAAFSFNDKYIPLWSGYASSNNAFGWPGTLSQRPTDGAGVVHSIPVGAPAAGVDVTFTVPANTRWRLISFRATLTAAVAVANRIMTLTMDDGATVLAESVSNVTQVASVVNTYNAFDSAPIINTPINLRTQMALPSNMLMGTGFRINTVTSGLQAADQWSAAQLLVAEWADLS
jgi:hypothetical protein